MSDMPFHPLRVPAQAVEHGGDEIMRAVIANGGLFIIGTECFEAEHRAVVRVRCVEIQRESGFFNNLGALEVLEKVWQDDDDGINDVLDWTLETGSRQAFRWRKAMDRVDGEYIMI